MELSVCIIVKNEEKKLRRALQSIKNFDLEAVVVDTGSTDKTVEVAREYTDQVYYFPWIDDFAAAKNFAIEKARYDKVLVLDSDEYFLTFDLASVEKRFFSHPFEAGTIKRKNDYGLEGGELLTDYTTRLFDRRYFLFEGRIHEQVVRKDRSPYTTYESGIIIGHDGYLLSKEAKEAKALRNRELLIEELKKKPEDTYLLYQLGKAYFMEGKKLEAVSSFEKAFEYEVNERLNYVRDMIVTYGYALLDLKEYEKALSLSGLYDSFSDSADFCFVMGLIYMNNALFSEAIREFLKATEFREASIEGVNGNKAFYNIAVILECLEKKEEAISYYKKCISYQKAEDRLKVLISS